MPVMAKDVCFLTPAEGLMAAPLIVTGECEGMLTLAQKVITQLYANPNSATRSYGGGLGRLLAGTNVVTANLDNIFAQAATEILIVLKDEQQLNLHNLPAEEQIKDLSVVTYTVMDRDSVQVTYSLSNMAGNITSFSFTAKIGA
jgi:hypothetical protein